MTKSIVEYENLLDSSFTDSNAPTLRTSLRPRWERKKHKQQSALSSAASNHGGGENTRPPLSNSLTSNNQAGDRFIPNRAGMNMELSKHLLSSSSSSLASSTSSLPTYGSEPSTENNNTSMDQQDDPNKSVSDAKKTRYDSNLSSALLGVEDLSNNRVISYVEKAPAPKGDTVSNLNILYSATAAVGEKKANTKLVTRQIPSAPCRILDAPDLLDDYYLNLLSWSDTNVLAVALGPTVYLWNAETGDIQELVTLSQDDHGVNAHVSSVSWVQQGGMHLAVGTSSGKTQLWDVCECKQLRGMDGHSDRVSSMAWNAHILTSGSRDTTIVQHDVRVARHKIASLSTHTQEVCGLTWSPDGMTLASGGNDNLLCIWDASTSAMTNNSAPTFQMTDHQAAVKALAWSPHERNLLATGGGTADRCIKFWNTRTGALLNSIDTGSQVCALQWSPYEKEILSSHGFARNQLCLWKYPSMAKIKELEGHTSRVLHMAVSPDGGTVVSAAGDETLRFWNVFAPPSVSATSKSKAADLYSLSRGGKARWTAQIR